MRMREAAGHGIQSKIPAGGLSDKFFEKAVDPNFKESAGMLKVFGGMLADIDQPVPAKQIRELLNDMKKDGETDPKLVRMTKRLIEPYLKDGSFSRDDLAQMTAKIGNRIKTEPDAQTLDRAKQMLADLGVQDSDSGYKAMGFAKLATMTAGAIITLQPPERERAAPELAQTGPDTAPPPSPG